MGSTDSNCHQHEPSPVSDNKYSNDIAKILISQEELAARVNSLAEEINAFYSDEEPIIILTVLKGAIFFVADLMRQLSIKTHVEFMAISSYGTGVSSSGVVRILKDLDRDIAGANVLIVEDIIDSGLTLSWLLRNLATRNPKSLNVCTLLRKPEAVRHPKVDARFVGFDIEDEFVVGYGLDYAESYRDTNFIGVLKEEVYS